jgi:hypothetical protein
MSAVYYNTGYTLKNGYWAVDLLPANERPSERDFRYHGPAGKDKYAASRRLMGEGQWAKNFRPLVGTARDGITMVGQVASLDASPIDVNLVACGNPLQAIGVGRGLFVRDAWLGLYMGWHIAINALCTEDAKLAILRAATDKSAMLQHYGLDLPAEDFPSLFFSKYLSDNGELRSLDGIGSIVDELSSRIEFITSGRADRNSTSESGHHSRHRRFDHKFTGTTRGRQAQRGEPLAISSALLTRYAYMRLLILWIHWANTKQELPLRMIPTEMQREIALTGKPLERTRIAVYRWAMANGYVSGRPAALDYLRAHLLPKFTASVQRGGLLLHRPKTGHQVELLHGAKFNHPYLAQAGIIQAASRGEKHIEVSADPDDLSQIILIDQRGVHAIPNIKDDALLINEGGIADLCAISDAEKLGNVLGTSQRDQDDLDQQSFRQEAEAEAKQVQNAARKALGKRRPPSTKKDGVRAAQALERRHELDNAIHGTRINDVDPVPGDSRSPHPGNESATPMAASAVSSGAAPLVELRMARLTRFNSERKFS